MRGHKMRMILTNNSTVVMLPPQELKEEASIEWCISIFDKTKFSDIADPFGVINTYWAWLPLQRRIKLFDIYKKISKEMSDTTNNDKLINNLQTLVGDLYKEMPLEELTLWVKNYSSVNYPDNFKEVHDIDDRAPERTYLISEYKDLVVITLALRAMLPIWGRYMGMIKKLVKSNWKEFTAIRIISKSYIHNTPAIERLRDYISSTIPDNNDNTSSIINGLSSSELVDWYLAVVVIRKLSAGDIESSDTSGNIVTGIHNFIRLALRDSDRRFGKTGEKWSENTPDDDQASKIEDYKIKQEISIGVEETINAFCTFNYATSVSKVDPTVPQAYLDIAYAETRVLVNTPLFEIQQRLVEWIFPEVISPYSVDYINKVPLVNLLACAHAVLWHWGLYELAAIASAHCVAPPLESANYTNNQEGISQGTLAMLNQIYPYQYNETSARKSNPAYVDIIETANAITSKQWRATANVELLKAHGVFVDDNGWLSFSRTLNEQLALLVIKVEEMRA